MSSLKTIVTALDRELVRRGLANSRSQASKLVRLGRVKLNNKVVHDSGLLTSEKDIIHLTDGEIYVSRAGLKLASVAKGFKLDFSQKTVLDVGSSTGGFTDYALQQGAKKVVAVDIGTNQLHPSLRNHEKVELHEKTDIRDFSTDEPFDIIVGDLSFVSLREILPHIATKLMTQQTVLVAMVKPQFEASQEQMSRGVIKNDKVRRQILKDFEAWVKNLFIILAKHDSAVAGQKGNLERFYLLGLPKSK